MDRSSVNPFADDVFVDSCTELPGVSRIHHETFQLVVGAVEQLVTAGSGSSILGRTFLVTAPRAGYGKTHLAARLRDHLRTIATTIVLPLDPTTGISWSAALAGAHRQLSSESISRNDSSPALREIARFFLSRLILHQLEAGAIREKDLPIDRSELRSNYGELFEPESPSKLTGWVSKRVGELSAPGQPENPFLKRLGRDDVSFWIRTFLELNDRGEVAPEPFQDLSENDARIRFLQLLNISSDRRPLLLVADGLDGFSESGTAGMEISGILTDIRESVARTVTLLAVNQEIWENVFESHLPTAWLDRLTGESSKLRAISPEEAGSLVKTRLKRLGIADEKADEFAGRVADENLWIDAETKLTPRSILRQSRDMWEHCGGEFLKADDLNPSDASTEMTAEAEALAEFTDKADFFPALGREARYAPPPDTSPEEPPVARPSPTPVNPFFAPEPEEHAKPSEPAVRQKSELTGIDSIIRDIRGSGKSVVSEMEAVSEVPPAAEFPNVFQAGAIEVKSVPNGSPSSRAPWTAPSLAHPEFPKKPAPPKKDVSERLSEKEEAILKGEALSLDLVRLSQFIRSIGKHHEGLSQSEERFPSSRSACLRWNVRNYSVVIGFESPKNVYFWNNLLQQSLASNRNEKIAAFSHVSESFDPSLFSSFGFSPAVIRGRIDIIEMSDKELSMIYAADETLAEVENHPGAEREIQHITRYLDPLWRRISQPI